MVSFLTAHLGYPIPSPAIFEKIGTAFRRAVGRFAEQDHIPVVRFAKADRKIDVMRPYLAAPGQDGPVRGGRDRGRPGVREGVHRRPSARGRPGLPWFAFHKADRRVTCYYFYLWDDDFGPAFIKICAYFPYPVKIWINGHEWAKRQAAQAGIGFTELSNGFAATDDPAGLQAICDRLGPTHDHRVRPALVLGPAAAADRRRPGRRVLVGAVDAPGRGLAHHRVHRTPPRPRVLRGPGRRQPRHRPPGPDRADLLPASGPARPPALGAAGVQDQASSPAASRSPSTPSTSTPASSST